MFLLLSKLLLYAYLFHRLIHSFAFKQVAELVASEFFEQGDMERFQLNAEPIVSKTVFDLIYLACISVNKDAALLEVCTDKMERFCMKLSTHSSTSPFLYYPWVELFKFGLR